MKRSQYEKSQTTKGVKQTYFKHSFETREIRAIGVL